MAKLPDRKSSSPSSTQAVARFLEKSQAISTFVEKQPRLLFAIDATASRQPTWDRACHLQQEMFLATAAVATLTIQLCFYRGFNELRASPWISDSKELAKRMARVRCEGGHTQIARLLRHALQEHGKVPMRAVAFIGDAIEENPDTLCEIAGQCGLRGLPLFLFQEGGHATVERTFGSMAKLSGGAFARFDGHSADTLASLLGAVASFAAGGREALEKQAGKGAKLLLQQLKD